MPVKIGILHLVPAEIIPLCGKRSRQEKQKQNRKFLILILISEF